MKKPSKWLYYITISLLLVACMFLFLQMYFGFGPYTDTNHLLVQSIVVKDDSLQVRGITADSALCFINYSYNIKDNNLYIRLRYGLPTKTYNSGDFNISINCNMKNINKVYLEGSINQDLKLIWSKFR